jgi:transcriptional regulator with XRE-family HTH domain
MQIQPITFFANQLQKALKIKYKKLPYATTFARNFNSSTKEVNSISSETARRWMQGKSKPKLDTIAHLCSWLNVSPEFFFNEEFFSRQLNGNTNSIIQAKLLQEYDGLNLESLKLILELMTKLKKIQKNSPVIDSELSDLKADEIIVLLRNK